MAFFGRKSYSYNRFVRLSVKFRPHHGYMHHAYMPWVHGRGPVGPGSILSTCRGLKDFNMTLATIM